jgi:hypothetical protein
MYSTYISVNFMPVNHSANSVIFIFFTATSTVSAVIIKQLNYKYLPY